MNIFRDNDIHTNQNVIPHESTPDIQFNNPRMYDYANEEVKLRRPISDIWKCAFGINKKPKGVSSLPCNYCHKMIAFSGKSERVRKHLGECINFIPFLRKNNMDIPDWHPLKNEAPSVSKSNGSYGSDIENIEHCTPNVPFPNVLYPLQYGATSNVSSSTVDDSDFHSDFNLASPVLGSVRLVLGGEKPTPEQFRNIQWTNGADAKYFNVQ